MSLYVTAFNGMGSGEDSGGGALQNLAGIEASDIMHIANDFLANEGVQSVSDGDFEATADGTNLEIDVATGVAYVMNDAWVKATSVTKFWRVESDAVEVVTLDAADVSLPRIDIIILQINDAASADDEASNVATVTKVTGTPNASPTAPTVPDDAVKLAEVYVDASVTTVSNGDITDSRSEVSLTGSAENTGGWESAAETWTYNSADDPTYTFYASGDQTGVYSPGMRIRLVQGGSTKYFIITAVSSYDGGNDRTTITVYGGTDYDLTSGTITEPSYSHVKAPFGFPLDPAKWTVSVSNASATQGSPAQNTWYNLGGNIVVPIGAWEIYYETTAYFDDTSSSYSGDALVTLSTANNTESDATMSVTGIKAQGTNTTLSAASGVRKSRYINLSSKTTYYLNCKTTISGVNNINIGFGGTNVIVAKCAYL